MPGDQGPTAFILNKPLNLEESLVCEFKQVIGQGGVEAIGKVVDLYVVAYLNETGGSIYWGIRDQDRVVLGVRLDSKMRDELLQVMGQKIAAIAPPVPADLYCAYFHPILRGTTQPTPVEDVFVVEVSVRAPPHPQLYLTGAGMAYRKTLGGIKKLTGAELLVALLAALESKGEASHEARQKDSLQIGWTRSIRRRAEVARPLIRGAHLLWVDDRPTNNLYERTALASLGISVDLAISTDEALFMIERIPYDLVLSDMSREQNPNAGIELLRRLEHLRRPVPLVFYVGHTDPLLPTPIGTFGITDSPDELFHYVFDVLERRTL